MRGMPRANPNPDFTSPYCQPFFLEGGPHAVLLIHGFTGSPGHMRPLGDALHRAGHTVQGLLLPGHGTTLAEMTQSGWRQWLGAAEEALAALRARYQTVSLAGLSMGGLISLRLAELHPVDCLLLFAPALKFFVWTNNLAPIAKYAIREVPWRHTARQQDPRFLSAYDIGYPGAPVSKVQDMMRLIRMTRPALASIRCPTLVVQSRYDESVHRSVPELIVGRIASQVKEILWLEESPHVCTLGADREKVFARSVAFLNENLPISGS